MVIDRNGNMKLNGKMKLDDGGRKFLGKMETDPKGLRANAMTVGLVPIPGTDIGFQLQLGPIGFGGDWNFGLVPPGSVISYSQPVVVSPYSPPYGTPAYVPPYQQQQPGVRSGQPLQPYYVPYPPEYAWGSSPSSNIPYPPGGVAISSPPRADTISNPPGHNAHMESSESELT